MAARTEKVAVTRAERRAILSCLDGSVVGVDLAVVMARVLTGNDNIDEYTVLTHENPCYGGNLAVTHPM